MFGGWNSEWHLEFIIIILQCMTQCCQYLLQNFRFAAVISLVTTWGIHSLVLNVVILWPHKENCICFRYPTFLFFLVLCQNLLNIYFGHPKPSRHFWFSVINYMTGQKLCHPRNCTWAAWHRLKKLDNLNEDNRSLRIFQRCRWYIKNLYTERATWSKFCSEDSQVLGATVQNSVTWDLCILEKNIGACELQLPALTFVMFQYCFIVPLRVFMFSRSEAYKYETYITECWVTYTRPRYHTWNCVWNM